MSEPLTNKLGHRIRRRGARTREALLAAVRELLEERGPGAVRIADVAQRAGVSAPSVYTYFRTVDEAALALCEAAAPDTEALATLLEGDWSGDEAFRACRAFVEAMAEVWRVHGAALRVERLMADRGDAAFAESRIRRLRRRARRDFTPRAWSRGWPAMKSSAWWNRSARDSDCCAGPTTTRPFWTPRPTWWCA
jgi:AcrR family transcriptional regulator